MSNRLLSPSEVCQSLCISRRTLQRLTDAGLIQFERVGFQLRFTEKSLADYRQRNTRTAKPIFAGALRSAESTKTNHKRWHVKRGIVSPACALCAVSAS